MRVVLVFDFGEIYVFAFAFFENFGATLAAVGFCALSVVRLLLAGALLFVVGVLLLRCALLAKGVGFLSGRGAEEGAHDLHQNHWRQQYDDYDDDE